MQGKAEPGLVGRGEARITTMEVTMIDTPIEHEDIGFLERLRLIIEAHVAVQEADAAQSRADRTAVAVDAVLIDDAPFAPALMTVTVAMEAHEGAALLNGRVASALRRVGELVWPDDASRSDPERTPSDWLWEPFTAPFESYWSEIDEGERAEHLQEAEARIASGEAEAFWRSVWAGAAEEEPDLALDEHVIAWAVSFLSPRPEAKLRYGAARKALEALAQEVIDEKLAAGELWRCRRCEVYFLAERHAPAAPGRCAECVNDAVEPVEMRRRTG